MNDTVTLYHLGSWYHCYNDDADVVSNLTGYKVFIDKVAKRQTIGFPERSINKVISKLRINNVSFLSDNDSEQYGERNNYRNMLRCHSQKLTGSFTVKYEGVKEIEEFTIGDNISEDAELTIRVDKANTGDIIEFNDNKVFIIDKKMKYIH